MSIETLQFVDKESLRVLTNQLFAKSKIRINERIIQSVDEHSTDKQVASAKVVHEILSNLISGNTDLSGRIDNHDTTLAEHTTTISNTNEHQDTQTDKLDSLEISIADITSIISGFTHLNIETVTGSIESVTEPSNYILYFQRDNEADTMWMLYIYRDGAWVNIGDTEVDLSVIWSKDETAQLREELGVHDVESVTDEKIIDMVDMAFSEDEIDYRMEPTLDNSGENDIVEYGTKLSDVAAGASMVYDGEQVPGTFSWVTTNEEFDNLMNDD